MLLDPIQSRIVLEDALQNSYAVLAVNADSHAAVTDCLLAAKAADSPIIIETSLWQLKGHSYGAGQSVLGLRRYLADLCALADSEEFKDIQVIFHTDHIKGPETFDILGAAIKGIKIGEQKLHASTVSLDASEFTDEQNIQYIKDLCEIALKAGVELTLEMESAVDDRITDAAETERLLGAVEQSYPGKIYLWAPGVGTQHGFTSDDGYGGFNPKVIEENLRTIKRVTGREFGVALHGSTGLSPEKLKAAAQSGVTKVNWSSESLYIRSMAAQTYYESMQERFDRKHKDWKNTVMDNGVSAAVSSVYVPKVIERLEILGSTGRASQLKDKL
jgi:fructose-bisphosphate aldolase, class II